MNIEIDDSIISIINLIPNPIAIIDRGDLRSANSAFLDFFGLSSVEEFDAKYGSLSDLFVKNNSFFTASDIKDDEFWTDYLFLRPKVKRIVSINNLNGELKDFEITLKKLEGESDYIVVFNDITSHISEKNEYEYFAYHDHLTKIYNRQKFDEMLVKAFENKKRYGDHLSIILIDIDHFKVVNDKYGHLVGDLVLVALVGIIAKALRINDIFARWGGEEFIILLPRTDIKGAFIKAEELRHLIETHVDKELPPVKISAGVIEVDKSDTMNSCLKRVDDALYKAKEERNKVVKIS